MLHSLVSPAPTRKLALVFWGALIGIIAFFCIHTGASLDVTNDAWIHGGYVEMDILQHYAGWIFYRNAPLDFPLGFTPNMLYPTGSTLTNTDSIPLVGILLGLVRDWLPPVFQYFGWYTLLCYALQGVAAAFLLNLFVSSLPQILVGCSLFVISPILVERSFRHTALASHFLILFALYLYFLNQKQGYRYRVCFVVLCALAMTLHPYFLPMLLALVFADTVQHAIVTRRWKGSLVLLAGCIGAALVTGWLIGAFSQIKSEDLANGYGFFGMNLNALFNPKSINFGQWSAFLPQLPQNFGNYDSFQYLGLGVLALGLFALVALGAMLLSKQPILAWLRCLLRRHGVLLACCACLSVFAISNHVSWFDHTLLQVPLPAFVQSLANTFRASGRLFWPVSYLLLLCIVVFWARRGRLLGTVVLCCAFVVQTVDLSPAFSQKRAFFSSPAQQKVYLHGTLWDTLAGQYTHLFSLDDQLVYPYAVALWCAENNTTSNDLFTSRYDKSSHRNAVQAAMDDFRRGIFSPDTLYVTCSFARFQQAAAALQQSNAEVQYVVTGAKVAALDANDKWYFIIPARAGLTLPPESSSFQRYESLPLLTAAYDDALWTNGVLNSDKRVILLYDDTISARELSSATRLVCAGNSYPILKKDYSDPGWIMVTLDIEDASSLAGQVLTGQSGAEN